jgi:hypothetical protein
MIPACWNSVPASRKPVPRRRAHDSAGSTFKERCEGNRNAPKSTRSRRQSTPDRRFMAKIPPCEDFLRSHARTVPLNLQILPRNEDGASSRSANALRSGMHSWHEPFDRIAALSEANGVKLAVPMMGEGLSMKPPTWGSAGGPIRNEQRLQIAGALGPAPSCARISSR